MTTQEKIALYLECQSKHFQGLAAFGPNNMFKKRDLEKEIIAMFPQDSAPKEGERRVSDTRFLNINLEEISSAEAKILRHSSQPTICIEYDDNCVTIGYGQ